MPDIAGFAAELAGIDLGVHRWRPDGPPYAPPRRTLDLWRVADLETIVDRDALLRADTPAAPPYWALAWIGARAIAAELLDTPPGADASVLDLGCGLGLSGVAAGLGGARVVFGDVVDAALAFARASARHHRLARFETCVVDFTRDRIGERFDLILAADVVYDPATYAPLAEFVDVHLAGGGGVLLTESLRADARRVVADLAGRGIVGTAEGLWVIEEGRAERVSLHRLRRQATPRA